MSLCGTGSNAPFVSNVDRQRAAVAIALLNYTDWQPPTNSASPVGKPAGVQVVHYKLELPKNIPYRTACQHSTASVCRVQQAFRLPTLEFVL